MGVSVPLRRDGPVRRPDLRIAQPLARHGAGLARAPCCRCPATCSATSRSWAPATPASGRRTTCVAPIRRCGSRSSRRRSRGSARRAATAAGARPSSPSSPRGSQASTDGRPRSRCSGRCSTPSTRSARSAPTKGSTATSSRAARPTSPRTRPTSGGCTPRSTTLHALGFTDDDERWLDATAARDRIDVAGQLGAAHTPHCAAIHPARLARGLADVVERAGVSLFEQHARASDRRAHVAHRARHRPRRRRRPRDRGVDRDTPRVAPQRSCPSTR